MNALATRSFARFRRLARLLALPVLLALLGAQHAALLHGLGHATTQADPHALAVPGSSAAGGTGGSDAGTHCDKCFQFAHLSDLASAAPPALLVPAVATEQARAQAFSERAADAPPASSRGPPRAL